MARTPKKFFGNWKMNGSFSFVDSFFPDFISAVDQSVTDTICIMPPACYIDYVNSKIASSGSSVIMAGAQDMSMTGNASGALTGQIGTPMYYDCGAKYVLIGQAEVRNYLGITNEQFAARITSAIRDGLKVVYCVGENLEEREAGQTQSVLTTQLTAGLVYVTAEQMENIVIAYEPVWAIGTGKTATADDAEDACAYIRSVIDSMKGTIVAENFAYIIYGGSVNVASAPDLYVKPDIDGLLVGGASIRPDRFAQIINILAR